MFSISLGEKSHEAMNLLGINSFPFTVSELKSKYRSFAKKWHPDKFTSPPKKVLATDMMCKANAAFEHISNLATEESKEEITLADFFKAEKENWKKPLTVYETCPSCGGSRTVKAYAGSKPCTSCSGNGHIWTTCQDCYGTGIFLNGVREIACKACDASGKFKTKSGKIVDCLLCEGTGVYHLQHKKKRSCAACNGNGSKASKCKECHGSGRVSFSSQAICSTCKGHGEVEMKLWNPVLKPGGMR